MAPTPLKKLVDTWLQQDQDPSTRAEIEALVSKNDEPELESRMRPRITFGTAGLRARMQAGFARMNGLTVAQASTGLAAHLLSSTGVRDAKKRGVVVGHDHRHNSAYFAELTAGALVKAGIRVHWLEKPVHTPLVPFMIDRLGAAAGVMITASHNPAQDNGYKVWWDNACQIIPPVDKSIAAAIDKNLSKTAFEPNLRKSSPLARNELYELEGMYCQKVKALVLPEMLLDMPPVVYTPLHGVGAEYLEMVFAGLRGFEEGNRDVLIPVPEQLEPDPSFPTVTFPNPEEAGALDLAFATADARGVRDVIALDPDADRFCAAEKLPDGTWHQFTGNQIGVLFASWLSRPEWDDPDKCARIAMLTTTVSTGMLKAMAQKRGFAFRETLTGFKWLGNAARDLQVEKKKKDPVFAFEEALGYMFPSVVFDKDGVAAAMVWLAMREHWRTLDEKTPYQVLQDLYAEYGYFADANSYLRTPHAAVTNAAFAHVRRDGVPKTMGRYTIETYRDLTTSVDTSMPDGKPTLPVDKDAQMITCELDDGTRFTVRGSGTEPKIKLYVESVGKSFEEAKGKARAARRELIDCWFGLEEWHLKLPEGEEDDVPEGEDQGKDDEVRSPVKKKQKR